MIAVRLAVTICILIGSCARPTTISPQHARQLFGVTLSPPAAALLNQVEHGFGKQVQEDLKEKSDFGLTASSEVDQAGTPIIHAYSSARKKITEVEIVHELFHLKLKLDGYPAFWTIKPPLTLPPISQEQLQDYVAHTFANYNANFYGTIEHAVFFPEMRSMGYDPDSSAVELLKTEMESQQTIWTQAVIYFAAITEMNLDNRQTFERIFREKQLAEAIKTGEKLRQFAIEGGPSSPTQAVTTFARGLSLLAGAQRFDFQGFTDKIIDGRTFKVATIQISTT